MTDEKKYTREQLEKEIIDRVMPLVWDFFTGNIDYEIFIENMINFLDGWANY